MILNCFSKSGAVLWLLGLILLPQNLAAHDPSAPKAQPGQATLNIKAPDFVLINQDGTRFESAKLRGKVVVIDFIYTTCTDVCPLFTANFAQLQRTLNKEHAGDVFFISITTDPEVDSPKVLKALRTTLRRRFQQLGFLDRHGGTAQSGLERPGHSRHQKRTRPGAAHELDDDSRPARTSPVQSLRREMANERCAGRHINPVRKETLS